MKRATNPLHNYDKEELISIHTLCEEGDLVKKIAEISRIISIHTLCEEGDLCGYATDFENVVISIHTLCEEGD